MEKHLLKNVPEKERIETLESSADKVENFSYTKPFTPDQIVVFKDELSTAMIDLNGGGMISCRNTRHFTFKIR
jgi:hypothetical protein